MNIHLMLNICVKKTAVAIFYGLAVTILGACSTGYLQKNSVELSPEDQAIQHKFRGINGGVLYFDASGQSKKRITMYNEKGEFWQAHVGIGLGKQQSTYPNVLYLPKSIHIIWRSEDATEKRRPAQECIPLKDGAKQCFEPCGAKGCPDYSRAGWEGGTVLGDYTVPLATRIPDEVLDYIRANGGALRVKIRLKDNGVAVGWDVEHIIISGQWKPNKLGLGSGITYRMAGGDFREAEIYGGKVIDPGWEN